MSLINCPECGHEISDLAAACPQCGMPITLARTVSSNKINVPLIISVIAAALVGIIILFGAEKLAFDIHGYDRETVSVRSYKLELDLFLDRFKMHEKAVQCVSRIAFACRVNSLLYHCLERVC